MAIRTHHHRAKRTRGDHLRDVEFARAWGVNGALALFAAICYIFPDMNGYVYLFALFLFSIYLIVYFPSTAPSTLALRVSANLSFFSFYYIPMVIFFMFNQDIAKIIAPLSLLCISVILLASEPRAPEKKPELSDNVSFGLLEVMFYVIASMAFVGIGLKEFFPEISGFESVVFFMCFSANAMIIEIAFVGERKKMALHLLFVKIFYFVLYLVFIWTGYGRIYLGMLAIPIYAIVANRGFFTHRQLLITLFSFAVVFVGNILRFGERAGLEAVLRDSTTSHLILADELVKNREILSLPSEMSGQFFLFFFNWFPRQVWPGKPVAIGESFVDYYMGRAGFGEGHSISIGIIGEHLYFVPHYWLVTLTLAVLCYIWLRRAIQKASGNFLMPVFLYDAGFITFAWGGLAAFGARYFFFVIPALILSMLVRPKGRHGRARRSRRSRVSGNYI